MNNKQDENQFLRIRFYQNSLLEKPNLSLILKEWFHAINIFKNPEAIGAATWLLYCLFTLLALVFFILNINSFEAVLMFFLFFLLHANIFHTFWYHRYASHKSYEFSDIRFAIFFKWINPLAIKEEIYVLPHFVHHRFSDTWQDPYGPHIGAIASFLSSESQFYFNKEMNNSTFIKCLKLLNHIPAKYNNIETFKVKGTFEPNYMYVIRILTMLFFWYVVFAIFIGRFDYYLAFLGSSFLFITIMRDFNYRGHDEEADLKNPRRIDKKSKAINQLIYGFFASEWHENHHRYSSSARCGFEKWQIDISFWFTLLLNKIGIIKSYRSSSESYNRDKTKNTTQNIS